MDTKIILALLILSHVIADFVLQDNVIVEEKKTSFKGMFKHIGHYLLINLILLLPYFNFNNNLWWIIISLSLAHWAIDRLKVEYDKKINDKGFESFMVDQVCHCILIGAYYPFIKDIQLNQFAQAVGSLVLSNYPIFLNVTKQNSFNVIIILTGYIFNFKGA
ncbi:hypothetical protein SPSIL_026700 [Sporomusa silvacetica DSM 10669]|uniref:DUF3307 domain-containing protein n=1 Tax=Sporomusa silvacetica DSM 10669 TaxID=1123289 RepID=A0ABZ3ILE8_9FIRM|nr:DUF3307 domain-containing protein [Sporomusa silvacetica]OZC15940.1 hypothetical protein SPSIL_39540 [Sporomusa silvacetica DSM 10669]